MSLETLVSRNLADGARRLLFTEARTNQYFLPKDVPESKLRELYDLFKWGPTAANCLPLRVLFVKSEAAKEKLLPGLMDSNREKSKAAPVVAVLAYDAAFYEHFPTLMPPMAYLKDYMKGNAEAAEDGAAERAAAGWVLHHRGTSGGPGCGADGRLRRAYHRQGAVRASGGLGACPMEDGARGEPRLRRRVEGVPACAPLRLRRGGHHRVSTDTCAPHNLAQYHTSTHVS
jgi:nitroreductase